MTRITFYPWTGLEPVRVRESFMEIERRLNFSRCQITVQYPAHDTVWSINPADIVRVSDA